MIEVSINDSTKREFDSIVSQEAEELGDLNGSIESGDGNYAGLFGELVFSEVFDAQRRNTYDYDVIFDGKKVDVKTKRRSVPPKPYYECSIADFNTEQSCDIYYFVSIEEGYDKVWLLGYKDTDEYYEQASFHEEGEVDPDNNFVFKADCWNLPISELDRFDRRKYI